jgi:predicted DNA-binding transcriptional regulator AlpA
VSETELRTQDEAAKKLRVGSPRTMERWRADGVGPRYVKIGARVYYRDSDLDEWVKSQVRSHTKQTA